MNRISNQDRELIDIEKAVRACAAGDVAAVLAQIAWQEALAEGVSE